MLHVHVHIYYFILLDIISVIIYCCSLCTSLDWDRDGDVLAVANDKNGISHNN